MKTHLPIVLRRALLLAMAAVCNCTLSYAEESTPVQSPTAVSELPGNVVWSNEKIDYSANEFHTDKYGPWKGVVLKLKSLTIKDNSYAEFNSNAATSSFQNSNFEGAVIYVEEGVILENSVINFNSNKVELNGSNNVNVKGSAIYANRGITATNSDVYFTDNFSKITGESAQASGGAAYVMGELTLKGNKDKNRVIFSGNKVEAHSKKESYGGALYAYYCDAAITNNCEVTFENNSINTIKTYSNTGLKAYGGAVCVKGTSSNPASLKITHNVDVNIEGNSVTTNELNSTGFHDGGFLYADNAILVEFNDNATLNIKDNYTKGEVGTSGGAMCVQMASLYKVADDDGNVQEVGGELSIKNNTMVDISGNYADSIGSFLDDKDITFNAYTARGGAISITGITGNGKKPATASLQISGNTDVSITNNAAKGGIATGGQFTLPMQRFGFRETIMSFSKEITRKK